METSPARLVAHCPLLSCWSIGLNEPSHRTSRLDISHLLFLPEIVKRQLLRPVRKRNFETTPRQNNPTGKSLKTLSSPLAKNIPLNIEGKSPAYLVCLTR
jgi:hypothetical protein